MPLKTSLRLCALLCMTATIACAQQPSLAMSYENSTRLYQQKKFADAAAQLEPFYEAGPEKYPRYWYTAMYDLACNEAQAGRKEKALAVLVKSQSDGGSVSAEHLATDTDLVSLHGEPQFEKLVVQLKTSERLWGKEPAQGAPLVANLSDDEKVAGLSTLWSEARFSFAFFDRQPDLDWNKLYVEFLPKVRATKSTEEYYRVLMRFYALLKDGHSNVWPPEALYDTFWGAPALHTKLIEDKVVVTAIDDPELAKQGWQVGDVLLKIGGEDVHAYAEREVAPYQSTSTPQDLAVRMYNYELLSGPSGSDIHVTVQDAHGQVSERVLHRATLKEQSKLKKSPKAAFAMRPDGVAVLTINEFEDTEGTNQLLAHFDEVKGAKGLIIDVRANGGGSTPIDLLQILARKPFLEAKQRTRDYIAVDRARGLMPGWKEFPQEEIPVDATHHVDVPIAVLTSAMTFSAGEDFVGFFDAMHRGITVGETTAGSTGQPMPFRLPGGGQARVCTKNDSESDGTTFEGIGLKPTIAMSPTIASVRAGADPAMDRAAKTLLSSQR